MGAAIMDWEEIDSGVMTLAMGKEFTDIKIIDGWATRWCSYRKKTEVRH